MKQTNFLKDKFPQVYAKLHATKNKDIDIEKLTYGSNKIVWWFCNDCPKGHHEWQSTVQNMTKRLRKGCPFCHHIKVCECDSLSKNHPKLMEEWNYDRNIKIGLNPKAISAGSSKVAHWICSNNDSCNHHKWKSQIRNRGIQGSGCPYCSKLKTCRCNSLSTKYPHLLEEWDYQKNCKLNPDSIGPHSSKRVNWICKEINCRFKWSTPLSSRTGKRKGCPRCKTSKLEKECLRILNLIRDEYIIKFNIQQSYSDCFAPDTGSLLKYDFRIVGFKNDTLVELDGKQHFEDVYFDGKTSELVRNQFLDNVKLNYCFDKGKNLLRISISEIDNIEKHLREFFELAIKNEKEDPIIILRGVEYLKLFEID